MARRSGIFARAMTDVSFYRWFLIAPCLIVPALALVPFGDPVFWRGVAGLGVLFGSVPYAVLAVFLYRLSYRSPFRRFFIAGLLSPILFVALLAPWTVLSLALWEIAQNDQHSLAWALTDVGEVVLPASVLGFMVSCGIVVMALLLHGLLRTLNFVGPD